MKRNFERRSVGNGETAAQIDRYRRKLPVLESAIEIAPDAPLGSQLWWLSCARGGTGGRPFVVGDLPEFIETESNSVPDKAESLTLPVTLNGQIDAERDMDYFCFDAGQGEVVVADVVAARIGSPLLVLPTAA